MINKIIHYFSANGSTYWSYVWQHISLSLAALLVSLVLGLSLGYWAYRSPRLRQWITGTSQALRVIPSLGVLFILIPFIGVGVLPALIALIFLGLPPILVNTVVGFEQVPDTLLETGRGLGMTQRQLMVKVSFSLALPYILNGIKLSLVEIIASATLATYIGAGGLGNLIFTGLQLFRYDLLIIGGGSVALLSFLSMLILDLGIKWSSIK
ncbi:ABC transporter permease [Streptococcus tangpeifui]|uniref:ABC transporter permease n=1 Tax=Streptococcus tangpeifui TaxID=2709400 RepID=UPI0013EA964A|nr:ABC transporter permease [Streptococcus sp. ZJ373]